MESDDFGEFPCSFNWQLCAICQVETSESLRTTDAGLSKLCGQIVKFNLAGRVSNTFLDSYGDETVLFNILHSNGACYHKSCYDSYNERSYDRWIINHTKDNLSSNYRSLRKRSHDCILGEPRCAICEILDNPNNLHRAGESTISQDKEVNYIRDKTNEWKKMADTPGYEHLQAKLSTGDLRSNEIFYHLKCLTKLKRDSQRDISNFSINLDTPNKFETFKTNYCFQKVIQLAYELLKQNPFSLIELRELQSKLVQYFEDNNIQRKYNITQFKNELSNVINDDFQIIKNKKVLYLGLSESIKSAASATMIGNDLLPEKINEVTKQVRDDMEKVTYKFDGTFSNDCEINSVPQSLIHLLASLIEGNSEQVSRGVLSVAQLVMFNFKKKSRKRESVSSDTHTRHHNETPLVIFLSLLLHNKYRSKEVMNTFHDLGLCLGYKRTMQIITDLGNAEVSQYIEQNLVCPTTLNLNLVTTMAIDNIDQSTSSTTAKSSFHGTAISITQHPDDNAPLLRQYAVPMEKSDSLQLKPLPEYYTTIPDVTLPPKSDIDESYISPDIYTRGISYDDIMPEMEWLDYLFKELKCKDEQWKTIHWAAYHASTTNCLQREKVINAVLPLFYEAAHSAAMISHGLSICIMTTNFLNPGQIPIVCFDQQLYAIGKQIQWRYPEDYGVGKLFLIMGGLHIEKQIEQILGSFFSGSGLTDLLVSSTVMSNCDKAFLAGSHITKTRYLYQVTVAVLYGLQMEAFTVSESCDVDKWISEKSKNSANFKYWSLGMELILKFLVFVRSIREANLDLFIDCLIEWVGWFFVFDHHNYARYVPVQLADFSYIKSKIPELYNLLEKGVFTANKTKKRFSAIHLDQNHEQMNDILKHNGGIVGLTENPQALKRYLVCSPLVSELCSSFEQENIKMSERHHSESASVQKRFQSDVKLLTDTILAYGNPFINTVLDITNIYSKRRANEFSNTLIYNIEKLGKDQFEKFRYSVFVDGSQSIHMPIKQNNVKIFGEKKPKKDKAKAKLKLSKTSNSVVTNLFISSQERNADLNCLFKHEIALPPPSLSTNGEIYFSNKSKFLEVLCPEEMLQETGVIETPCTMIIDGSFMVQSFKPGTSKDFGEYLCNVILPFVTNTSKKYKRVDVIFDRYFSRSIKNATRTKRGEGDRYLITLTTPIPRDWSLFLRNSDNKTQLFIFLAENLIRRVELEIGKTLYCSFESTVLTNPDVLDISFVSPCTHEEADTRIFVHVKDAIIKGCTNIAIRATDTDIIIIAASLFEDLSVHRLWVYFGTSKRLRVIPIHRIFKKLGPQICKGLLFFHALTGADTTAGFVGFSKISAWNIWKSHPEMFNELFAKLSHLSTDVLSDDNILNIEYFVSLLYKKSKQLEDAEPINETRKKLFLSKATPLEKLPPTKDTLMQKVKRCIFQSDLWRNSLLKDPKMPETTSWGWVSNESNDDLRFDWAKLPDVVKGCWQTFIKCSCKKNCTGNCSCFSRQVSCTALCSCKCIYS